MYIRIVKCSTSSHRMQKSGIVLIKLSEIQPYYSGVGTNPFTSTYCCAQYSHVIHLTSATVFKLRCLEHFICLLIWIILLQAFQSPFHYKLLCHQHLSCHSITNCFAMSISVVIPLKIALPSASQLSFHYKLLCHEHLSCHSITNCFAMRISVVIPLQIALP